MNTVVKNQLKIFISGSLAIISFFLWYLFSLEQEKLKKQKQESTTKYIEIKTTKNAIKIISIDDGIDIIVNGKKTSSGSISLK